MLLFLILVWIKCSTKWLQKWLCVCFFSVLLNCAGSCHYPLSVIFHADLNVYNRFQRCGLFGQIIKVQNGCVFHGFYTFGTFAVNGILMGLILNRMRVRHIHNTQQYDLYPISFCLWSFLYSFVDVFTFAVGYIRCRQNGPIRSIVRPFSVPLVCLCTFFCVNSWIWINIFLIQWYFGGTGS